MAHSKSTMCRVVSRGALSFPRDNPARFVDSVTYGVRGMPPWGDVIKQDEIEALWAYVVAGEKK